MKKITRSLLFFLVSVVVISAVAFGAIFLLNKKPAEPLPINPTYTEEEKDFITSIENGMQTLKTTEPVSLVSASDVGSLYNIYDVVGDYVVAKKVVGATDTMAIYKISDGELEQIEGSGDSLYTRVFEVYDKYALVSNNLSDYSDAFIINLETKERVGSVSFSFNDFNAFLDASDNLTYTIRYSFVNGYFIQIYETTYSDSLHSTSYKFKMLNLTSGEFYDFSAENKLASGEVILDYSLSFNYFAIKTNKKSVVYKLNANSLDAAITKENIISTSSTSELDGYKFDYPLVYGKLTALIDDDIYDYYVGETKYYSVEEYNLTLISENKVFINKLSFATEEDVPTINIARDNNKFKPVIQECSVINTANGALVKNISYKNEFIEIKESKLDGFVLLVGTKIFAENDYKIQYNNSGLETSEVVARYLQSSNLESVVEYNYRDYGEILAYVNEKLLCLKDVSASTNVVRYKITPIDFQGKKLDFGNFDIETCRVTSNSFAENYFSFISGSDIGIADYNGNIIDKGSYSNISPVINGYYLVRTQITSEVDMVRATTKEASIVSNFVYELNNGYTQIHTNNKAGYKRFGDVGITPTDINYFDFALSRGMSLYFAGSSGNYTMYKINGEAVVSGINNYFFVKKADGFITIYQKGDNIYAMESTLSRPEKTETVAQARQQNLQNSLNIKPAFNNNENLVNAKNSIKSVASDNETY
ncbi:MAG: hypothetical protein IJT25_00730, partial [Clostridia bacterium]|nr:hypothetical protein [Clostridia bacterium]